jgi:hypothetical protein
MACVRYRVLHIPLYIDAKSRLGHNMGSVLGFGIGIFFSVTVIGPVIGLALFCTGFAVARQKRFICLDCGNELARELRLCPACNATYYK